jgi:hypothetical protein
MGDIYITYFGENVKTWRRCGWEDNIKMSLKNKTTPCAGLQ